MASIEFLLLANHIEAVNGLLYCSGGGWSDHWRGQPVDGQPPVSHFGIGVSALVPWTETNRVHRLKVWIETEDATDRVAEIQGDLEMGRPAGIPAGSDQRAMLALNMNTVFPQAGGYRIVAELGNESRSVSFRVHDQIPPPGGVQQGWSSPG